MFCTHVQKYSEFTVNVEDYALQRLSPLFPKRLNFGKISAMKRKFFSIISAALLTLAAISFSSCSQKIMGYSILLWNVPEYNLADGTIVPVYIKSNVSHVYVIGIPESKEKIEVPLWQISEPQKIKKTEKLAQRYTEYEHMYARCVLDGLPIRADKVNTSKQVYRLRKGEVIRTLYEANGVAVMTGKNAMEGKWLRVITNTGVTGWCFSYNLRLFEMNADGTPVEVNSEEEVEEKDDTIEKIIAAKWYPENYSAMIKSGNIDFSQMKVEYGFTVDEENSIVTLRVPRFTNESTYGTVSKTDDNVYKFTDSPYQITVRNNTFIVVQFTGDDGKPVSYNMISLDADIEQIISDEKEKRAEIYRQLCEFGPDFKSTNYGTITFESDNTFKWSDFKLLVPTVLTSEAKGSGTVEMKYLLSSELKKSWNGVITCHFDGMKEEVNFIYKMEKNGLRLEDVSRSEKKGNTILSRSQNSLVMFFAK